MANGSQSSEKFTNHTMTGPDCNGTWEPENQRTGTRGAYWTRSRSAQGIAGYPGDSRALPKHGSALATTFENWQGLVCSRADQIREFTRDESGTTFFRGIYGSKE
jgi:hypothetical protein